MSIYRIPGQTSSANDLTINNTTVNGTFTVDGYTIDLNTGATIGQVLTYDGYNFISANVAARYDIRDFGAIDDDFTDCGPALLAAYNAAIAADGYGPIYIYVPATPSYWRIKTGVVISTGSHTDFGPLREIYVVGEGDAGPIRVDCVDSDFVFGIDFGNGQVAYRDMRAGFKNLTFVTSNDTGYLKGPDCGYVFFCYAADTAPIVFENINIVGVWSNNNHMHLEDGSWLFNGLIVSGGYCGTVGAPGAKSVVTLTAWAICDAANWRFHNAGHLRGTTWPSSLYASFWEVTDPQDYDSTFELSSFFVDSGCSRIVWCNQVSMNRLRRCTATDFVTFISTQPAFDMNRCVVTTIKNGEFEIASGSIFAKGTNCDATEIIDVRSSFGSTAPYCTYDSTNGSVLLSECDLGTDSPHPAGVVSDAAITRVIKGGIEGMLFKASATVTDGYYAKITGDNTISNAGVIRTAEVIGISQVSGVTDDYVTVATKHGQIVTMISDGTSTIAAGDPIVPGSDGLVLLDSTPASNVIIGRALTGATNVLGTSFKAIFYITWGT